jgi:hypothetical protein
MIEVRNLDWQYGWVEQVLAVGEAGKESELEDKHQDQERCKSLSERVKDLDELVEVDVEVDLEIVWELPALEELVDEQVHAEQDDLSNHRDSKFEVEHLQDFEGFASRQDDLHEAIQHQLKEVVELVELDQEEEHPIEEQGDRHQECWVDMLEEVHLEEVEHQLGWVDHL